MDRKKINCFSAASIALMTIGFSSVVSAAEYDVDFDPTDFPVDPGINTIDNSYWPLLSGTSFVYSAETEDGCEVNRVTVTSNTKGFLPPRMTTTERNAIGTPTNGLLLYNTTTNKLTLRENGSWVELGSGGGSGDITNGGNTTGAAITIGTNDNFALNFETNGSQRLSISNVGLLNSSAVSSSPNATVDILSCFLEGGLTPGIGFGMDINFDMHNEDLTTVNAGFMSVSWANPGFSIEKSYVDFGAKMSSTTAQRMLRLDGATNKIWLTPNLPSSTNSLEVSGTTTILVSTAASTLQLNSASQVQIGSTNADIKVNPTATGSAVAEITSTTKGFLIPRMTRTQRNAITGPGAGLLIYQTDGDQGLKYFTGTTWSDIDKGITIVPTAISAHQNNYTPSNFAEATQIKISSTGELWAINGFAYSGPSAPEGEDRKVLVNNGSLAIMLNSEHPSTTAAYRINHDGPYVLLPGRSVDMRYDGTLNRWKLVSNENTIMGAAIKSGVYYNYMASSITDGELTEMGQGTSSGTITASAPTASIPVPAAVLSTSTSTTGAAALTFTKGVVDFGRIGSGVIFARSQIAFPTLSTGVQTYTWGMSVVEDNSVFNYTGTNEFGVKYSSGLNSGKFQGYTRNSSGTESTVDLGVTVAANTVYDVACYIDDSVSEIIFYINGAYAGRLTTNLPASGTNVGSRVMILKSAGSTAATCHVSRFESGVILP